MRALLVLLLAPVAFSSSAMPAPPPATSFELVGSVASTEWATGSAGTADRMTNLEAPGLLQALEVGERGDKPCYVKAIFAGTNGQKIERVLDECGSRGPTNRSLREVGEFKGVTPPHGIRTLAMCDGESSLRMKGLRLGRYDLTFASDGMAQPGSEYERVEFSRTNCSLITWAGWTDTVTCPGNHQFAVGLRLALYSGGVGDFKLLCQDVRQPAATSAPRPRRIGGATLSPSPSSGPTYTPTGSFTTRHISGEAGTSLRVINGRPNEVLYGAEFGERSDEPCFLKTYWWDATRGRNDVRTRTQTWNQCNGTVGQRRYVGPSHSQIEGTTGPLRGVDRLVVCTNGRNGNNLKLKGVRLRGSQPNESQNTSQGQNYEFERSNCSDWATTGSGMCTASQHAVGLEVHHNTVGGRGSITGITLRCKDIDVD